jgi:SAM-dependent methyltransferase
MNVSQLNGSRLRILVAISSYGEKNRRFLDEVIQSYRRMPFDIDIVVLSEAEKDLNPSVRVVVGLPTKNPWSLPFGHKKVFAENAERYDLFAYSEDDILVTEANIRAFLEVTPHLATDEIAGFMHYEQDQSGTRFVNPAWNHYHWKPESARRRGEHTFAEFTNEHSAFYLLTQAQLQRAIASGGYLRGPCTGRYSWPETAATDPYTNCGFRKVICISNLEDFLIHHMPNLYVAHLISVESFKEQIQALLAIRDGQHPAVTLFEVESELWPWSWNKSYYEKPAVQLLDMVPPDASDILSVGCGWGETETALQQRGSTLTAIPLDSVIGTVAERRGVEVIYADWNSCLQRLEGKQFDCVLISNLLHLQPNPDGLVEQCSRLVRKGGWLVIAGPNFERLFWLIKRTLGIGGYQKLRTFASSGFHRCGPTTLGQSISRAGLRVTDVQWLDHSIDRGWLRGRSVRLGGLTARNWLLRAHRTLTK